MKITHISTTDTYGGAALSAYRLHKSLLKQNIDSTMFVQFKFSKDNEIIKSTNVLGGYLRVASDRFLSKFAKDVWSSSFLPTTSIKQLKKINPDVIQLHWINNTLSIKDISKLTKLNKPLIWTMHDMWAFGGGYHYFKTKKKGFFGYLEKMVLNYKKRSWKDFLKKVTVVTPSNWLAKEVKKSHLFRHSKVKVIPYGLDLNEFKPIINAKEKLQLDKKKKYVLFGAVKSLQDKRKGADLLLKSLKYVKSKNIELLIFGSESTNIDLPIKAHFMGHISDKKQLATIYSAADVFVAPSRMDNLPNTVLESLACATPVVAFDIGGMPDMIVKNTGFLAKPYDIRDLARKIDLCLSKKTFGSNARKHMLKHFNDEINFKKYQNLYEDLLCKK